MNRYLNIQLVLQRDGILRAIDFSDYNSIVEDIENHVMLDFMTFKDLLLKDTINLRTESLNRGYYRQQFETVYNLTNDGTYTYYKFVIPTYEHFIKNDSLNIGCDELFYYNNCIYLCTKDIKDSQKIIESSQKINSITEIYNIVNEGKASQTFYLPAKKIFSINKLNKCLISLQKEIIMNNNCADPKKIDRDFLFGATYVLDYLIDTGNYNEAQRILDNLGTCNYCQEVSYNKCNCG